MGNDYKLCHHNTIQQTNFPRERTQPKQFVPLVQTFHKTLQDFLEDNKDFFDHDGMAIAHIVMSHPGFQQQINKFPIQRIGEHKRIFFPNLTKEQFNIYEGECLFLDFKNCQLYLGEVNCGKKWGHGFLITKNGNKFQGNWVENMQNGQGKLQILYPKRTYQGTWRNGKLEGKGQATYEDGAQYDGHFYQGKKHGMGILTFYDGAVFQGSFQEDLMHGFGTLTTKKGRQISGQWKNGKYQPIKPDRSSKTFSINQLPAI